MRKFKVPPIPRLDGLMFMGEKDPRFVKGIHPLDEGSKKNIGIDALLSAMAFEKGLKKGEPAYLVALIEV